MFEKYLQDIGLSDKEAKVYLALLAVDNDSVLDISKKTEINRTTIYPVLESLSKKGLISEVKLDNKIRYQAETPERLETYVERRKILLEEQEKVLRDVIPQLKSIQREGGERPIVKIYEGRDGIISSVTDLYESAGNEKETFSIYSKDLLNDIFTKQEQEKIYNLRRNIKNMLSHAVYVKDGEPIPDDSMSRRVRFDKNKYPIFCDITITGDEVRISSLRNKLSSVYIKSSDFSETIKNVIKYILDVNNK